MATCAFCNSTILFGGASVGGRRFCNARCAERGTLLTMADQIPEHLVQQQLWSVHQGRCPKCTGPGPVDVHTSHRVVSMIVVTTWKSQPRVSCARCGHKAQAKDAAISLVAGWWGFPWGLIFTPIQISRNIAGMMKGPDPAKPSAQLEKMVRMSIAANAAAQPPAAAAAKKPAGELVSFPR
jgi:hypothetical protein